MKYTYNLDGKLVSLSCREEWKPTADFLAGIVLEEERAAVGRALAALVGAEE